MGPNLSQTSDSDGWSEITIPLEKIVSRLGWWLLAVALILYGPLLAVSGLPEVPVWPPSAVWLGDLAVRVGVLLLAYVLTVPVHEGLHAAGMLLTGSRRSDIRFGARLRHGIVYVHCKDPMTLSAYRLVLLLPVVVTGFVPATWALVTRDAWILTYAYLMIVSAVGDLEMWWRLRDQPREVLVRDHPSMLGCEVRRPE